MNSQNLPAIFNFQNNELKMITKNDEPWFVAKDICKVLGISKYRDAISRLDDDERASVLLDTHGGPHFRKSRNGTPSQRSMMTMLKLIKMGVELDDIETLIQQPDMLDDSQALYVLTQ